MSLDTKDVNEEGMHSGSQELIKALSEHQLKVLSELKLDNGIQIKLLEDQKFYIFIDDEKLNFKEFKERLKAIKKEKDTNHRKRDDLAREDVTRLNKLKGKDEKKFKDSQDLIDIINRIFGKKVLNKDIKHNKNTVSLELVKLCETDRNLYNKHSEYLKILKAFQNFKKSEKSKSKAEKKFQQLSLLEETQSKKIIVDEDQFDVEYYQEGKKEVAYIIIGESAYTLKNFKKRVKQSDKEHSHSWHEKQDKLKEFLSSKEVNSKGLNWETHKGLLDNYLLEQVSSPEYDSKDRVIFIDGEDEYTINKEVVEAYSEYFDKLKEVQKDKKILDAFENLEKKKTSVLFMLQLVSLGVAAVIGGKIALDPQNQQSFVKNVSKLLSAGDETLGKIMNHLPDSDELKKLRRKESELREQYDYLKDANKDQIQELEAKIKELQASLSRTKEDSNKNANTENKLKDQNLELTGSIKNLTTEIASLKSLHQAELERLNEEIAQLENKKSQDREKITALKTKKAALEAEIEALNSQITSLETQVYDLKEFAKLRTQTLTHTSNETESFEATSFAFDLLTATSEVIIKPEIKNNAEFEINKDLPQVTQDFLAQTGKTTQELLEHFGNLKPNIEDYWNKTLFTKNGRVFTFNHLIIERNGTKETDISKLLQAIAQK